MKRIIPSFVLKCCLLTLLISSKYSPSSGQYSDGSSFMEAGITIGPSNILGDLGGNLGKGTRFLKDNNIQMTKLTYGAFLSYYPSEWFGFRFSVNFGTLEGDDAIIKGKGGWEEQRRRRNSNFKSKFYEGLLMAEIYPSVFFEYDPADTYHKFRPYGLAGIGVFKFNPQGTDPLTGQWVDLKPLHTEGQGFPEYPDRKEYKLIQMNIPTGIGVKYFMNDIMNLSLEVIHRFTFTDYIDDVSTRYIDPSLFYAHLPLATAQVAERVANKSGLPLGSTPFLPGQRRGETAHTDAYYSIGFKVAWRLGASGDNRWRNSTRCPIRF